VFFFRILGTIMVDAKPDRRKVDWELGKQLKVEEQRSVDVKPTDKPPKVVAPKVDVVAHKVDFRIKFTTKRNFKEHGHMLSWVRDLAVK
jgi:hypothetical protein